MADMELQERWNLAYTLDGILGADLDFEEEEAIKKAIRIICPEYAKKLDDIEKDVMDWWENTKGAYKNSSVEDEKYKLRFGEEESDG